MLPTDCLHPRPKSSLETGRQVALGVPHIWACQKTNIVLIPQSQGQLSSTVQLVGFCLR
jgi:hypothetical protein